MAKQATLEHDPVAAMVPDTNATRWWLVLVLCAAAFVSYTDRLILGALVDPIRHDLNLRDSGISLLQGAAFAVIYVLAGLPLGRIADRASRTWMIVLGSMLWCCATIACGLAPGFWTLGCARLCVGVGEAALGPAAVSLIADHFDPKDRGVPIGLLVTSMIIGGPAGVAAASALLQVASSGFFLGWPLLASLAPWRIVLIVLGAGGLVVPAVCLVLREPVRRGSASIPTSLSVAVAYFRQRARVLLPLYAGMGLLSIGDYSLLSWMPSLLTRRFHCDPATAGIYFGLVTTISSSAGCIGGGALFDALARARRNEAQRYFLAAAATFGIIGAGLVAAGNLNVSLAGLAAWMLASTAAGVAGITTLQGLVPNELRGTGISLISFCNTLLGLGAGPTLVALVTERLFRDPTSVGFAMFITSASAALVATVLFIMLFPARPSTTKQRAE